MRFVRELPMPHARCRQSGGCERQSQYLSGRRALHFHRASAEYRNNVAVGFPRHSHFAGSWMDGCANALRCENNANARNNDFISLCQEKIKNHPLSEKIMYIMGRGTENVRTCNICCGRRVPVEPRRIFNQKGKQGNNTKNERKRNKRRRYIYSRDLDEIIHYINNLRASNGP